MLWTLVVGAVVGAVLLLAGLYSGGGRAFGTCLLSAVAAGLMMPVGGWLDNAARRRAGVVGSCVVITAFLLALCSIWVDAVVAAPWQWQWQLAMSAVATAGIGGVCSLLLAMATMPELKWPARIGVPLGAACLVLGFVSIWMRTIFSLWELFAVLTWTSAAVSLALVNFPLDLRHWRWLGIGASAVLLVDAFSMFLGNGTFLGENQPFLWWAAGSVAVVNVLLTLRIPRWAGFLRWSAIVCSTVGAFLAAAYQPILLHGGNDDDWVIRLIGALALLAGCSAVGLVVAVRLGATTKWTATSEPYKALTISCPRCAKRQPIALPESACVNCRLRFRVSMHDDRCPTCGYDTSGLNSPVCPECGGGVMLRSAWDAAAQRLPDAPASIREPAART